MRIDPSETMMPSDRLSIQQQKNKYAGQIQNESYNRQLTTYFFQSSNTFSLGKNWAGEISGWYQSRFISGTFDFLSGWLMSSGIQKQLWNKKATIKFNVNDIFWTGHFSFNVKYQNLDMTLRRPLDSRWGALSFTYRFGKNTVVPANRRNGGADDERKRIQSGG